MRVNSTVFSSEQGYQEHTAVESNDGRHWFAMNKPLYFWFLGWGGASVLVSGRAGPCMLLHQPVDWFSQHTEKPTGQQAE